MAAPTAIRFINSPYWYCIDSTKKAHPDPLSVQRNPGALQLCLVLSANQCRSGIPRESLRFSLVFRILDPLLYTVNQFFNFYLHFH